MRGLEIDDHLYDLQKLQRERKYEGQSRIKEMVIDKQTYKGTINVIKGIEQKMKEELNTETEVDLNSGPSELEKKF